MSHRLAGEVAIDLARQPDPCALRDRLGLVVDHFERHVAGATGPTPYPWRSLQALRQDLGATYLEATALARRLEELDRVLGDHAVDSFDLVPTVDLGLRLAGHHLANVHELMIDLGDTPRVRGTALALIVAQLVAACAGRRARCRTARCRSRRCSTGTVRWSRSRTMVAVIHGRRRSAIVREIVPVGWRGRCGIGRRAGLRVRA
jgi:hypothetical protein